MNITRRGVAGMLLPWAICFGQYQRGRRPAVSRNPSPNGLPSNLAGTFHGILKQLTKKEIVVLTAENQTVAIRLSKKTKFLKSGKEIKPTDINLDTPVAIDATEDIDLKPIALSVTVETPAH